MGVISGRCWSRVLGNHIRNIEEILKAWKKRKVREERYSERDECVGNTLRKNGSGTEGKTVVTILICQGD